MATKFYLTAIRKAATFGNADADESKRDIVTLYFSKAERKGLLGAIFGAENDYVCSLHLRQVPAYVDKSLGEAFDAMCKDYPLGAITDENELSTLNLYEIAISSVSEYESVWVKSNGREMKFRRIAHLGSLEEAKQTIKNDLMNGIRAKRYLTEAPAQA